jgi:hypothetical protein
MPIKKIGVVKSPDGSLKCIEAFFNQRRIGKRRDLTRIPK